MNLTKKLGLNMEIEYVPTAKLKHVKEMMFNWRRNNKIIRVFSFVAAATSIVNIANFTFEYNEIGSVISCLMAILLLLTGFFVTKSSRFVYVWPYISLAGFSVLVAYYPDQIIKLFFMVTVFVPSLLAAFFSYKALYNYKNVYELLKKRKGFPDFVFSTADMYADKIYLKDKNEKTVAEKRVEAAYNPFNEQSDILDEEVERMNSLRYEGVKHLEQDVAGKEYYKDKEKKNRAEEMFKFSKGLKIGNVNIIIPHDKIEESSKDKNRIVMGEWNNITERMFKNEALWIGAFLAAIMIRMWTEPTIESWLLYLFLAVYIFGTNFIKMGNPVGIPLVFSVCLFPLISTDFFTYTVVALFVLIKGPGYARWLCNYPIYRKLSKQPGFPSFIETTTDKYADQLYIVEKREPVKKGPKIDPIIMNIGYDDDEAGAKLINEFDYREKNKENVQEENTAWNAFNYLENDTENSAYDEFEIYEEVNRRRREAAVEEAMVKPNKNMGRRNTDED